jgi:hypothetical protein
VAQIVLDSVRAQFAESGVDLPLRQYIAVGPRGDTIHDCAQLTVSYEMSYTGTPGMPDQSHQTCDAPTSASFIVELVRKVPVSKNGTTPVNQDILTEYSLSRLDDVEILMDAAKRAIKSTWYEKGILDINAGNASGEYQAIVLTVIALV